MQSRSNRRKKVRAPEKSISEPTLCAELCRLLSLQKCDTLEQVREVAVEDNRMFLARLMRTQIHPYPWVVPITSQLMTERPTEQLATDLLALPDTVYLVRDVNNTGGDGLFLAWSGSSDPLAGYPVRGIINHFDCGGWMTKVTAIQLKSCLR